MLCREGKEQRWWAQTEHKETLFYWEGDQTLAQVTQRGYGVSILGNTQNPGHIPGQPAVGNPAWAEGEQDEPQRCLPSSALLWLSEKSSNNPSNKLIVINEIWEWQINAICKLNSTYTSWQNHQYHNSGNFAQCITLRALFSASL